MRTLYHWPFDPASRQARIALAETKLKFRLEAVNPWQPPEDFMQRCIEGRPPALIDHTQDNSRLIAGSRAICEYAHDISTKLPLIPKTPFERAEMRRLCDWFDTRFSEDVIGCILGERLEKSLNGGGAPDADVLQLGRQNLEFHLSYMTWLLERRTWLAGEQFSLADIAASASLSCLDYFSEISWKAFPRVKSWYQTIKSRPSLRPLLQDRLPSLLPPRHYSDLDF
jgi:glutathione S-transferase